MTHIPNLPLIFQFCSRLCHDLAAPLGAMTMGVELLEEEISDTSALNVLKTSGISANNKLQLMRCLFGFSSTSEAPSYQDLNTKIQQVLAPKINLIWPALQPQDTPYGEGARLIGALIMIASEGCPRGGTLSWERGHVLVAKGDRVGLSKEHVTALETPDAATPRLVMTAITGYLARSLGVMVHYAQRQDAFSLEVVSIPNAK